MSLRGNIQATSVTAAAAFPLKGKLYIGLIIAAGAVLLVVRFPPPLDSPGTFVVLLALSVGASILRIRVPLLKSGKFSSGHTIDLAALVLLGPDQTMLIAMASAWAASTVGTSGRNPPVRIIFNMAALVLVVQAAGLTFRQLGGTPGLAVLADLGIPLLGAAAVYFLVNTTLVAAAIAFTTEQALWRLWCTSFLWIAPTFFVGALAAAVAALVIARAVYWPIVAGVALVYLNYRAYKIYFGRIEEDRERLAVTLASLAEAVIATDIAGRIVLMNPMAEQMTGRRQDEARGRPIDEVLRTIDPTTRATLDSAAALACQGRAGTLDTGRAVMLAVDGSERAIELRAAPVRARDGDTIGSVIAFRDVTELMRVEEERLRSSKLESVGVLAGGIAHDFNNILTAVIGNIELARLDLGDDSEPAARLNEAEAACVRARALTHQLLTFSKGGAPIKRPVRLRPLVEDSVRFALRGSNVSAVFTLPDDLWPIEADEGQLGQVLNNLVINAKQAMPAGGIVRIAAANLLRYRPVHGPAGERDWVRITIEDRGVGIPPANLSKIFDPYFTTKETGSGLGLAAAHSIVKSHGGYIDVASTVGVGTTVNLYVRRTSAVVEEPVVADLIVRRGRGRILLLDDDEMVREVTGEMLESLGYQADLVSSETEAVDRFRSARAAGTPHDAVILDLTIPGGPGGQAVLTRLLKIDPHVRAIVSSGYARDPVLANFRDYGFAAVVTKPFTARELGAALATVLQESGDRAI